MLKNIMKDEDFTIIHALRFIFCCILTLQARLCVDVNVDYISVQPNVFVEQTIAYVPIVLYDIFTKCSLIRIHSID